MYNMYNKKEVSHSLYNLRMVKLVIRYPAIPNLNYFMKFTPNFLLKTKGAIERPQLKYVFQA